MPHSTFSSSTFILKQILSAEFHNAQLGSCSSAYLNLQKQNTPPWWEKKRVVVKNLLTSRLQQYGNHKTLFLFARNQICC